MCRALPQIDEHINTVKAQREHLEARMATLDRRFTQACEEGSGITTSGKCNTVTDAGELSFLRNVLENMVCFSNNLIIRYLKGIIVLDNGYNVVFKAGITIKM